MSRKIIFGVIFISILFLARSNAAVFTVNGPDSTFTSIQPAIDSCSYNDTVLVYPGVYYENLVIDMGITLASLYLIEQDPAYINETIIDGSGAGSCIYIGDNYFNVVICGFTITNGNAESAGGGIRSGLASISINDCIIKNNYAGNSGGGIAAANGHIFLSNVSIFHNKADHYSGGAYLAGSWTLMDSVNRCNIYENFAPHFCDMSFTSYSYPSSIYLDTFSVVDPGMYFLRNYDSLDVYINHGKHEQIPADFFVSPAGDNSNSGTSPEEPLKNLWMALVKIMSSDQEVRTIHLAPGIYSPSSNEEKFPLGCKNNIEFKGISSAETILDGDSISIMLST